jgi:predicted RNA-binding Zn ribbon-like protein
MTKTVRSLEEPAVSAQADEDLLLALINSTPTLDGTRQDDLEGNRQARTWLAEHLPDAPRTTDLELLRATRTALQQVIRQEAGPETLNAALDAVRLQPTATRDGVVWTREVAAGAEVAARAVLAWGQVEATIPGRLRACGNPDCTLFFIDRSRPNSGRWCSMAVCGNRMKARRHYARSKAE